MILSLFTKNKVYSFVGLQHKVEQQNAAHKTSFKIWMDEWIISQEK